jgi:type I restriction enzyme S subunit
MSKVLLGDVAAERRETCKGSKDGYPTVGLEHLTPEEITLASWDDGSDNTFTKMFHKGDVLFGRRRAYLKKAVVAPFDGICSGDITVITSKPDYLLPELLPFIIQNDTLFDFAVEKSAGSLSPRVKWEHLKNYEFSLPDMKKQHELSELLWAMDATKKSYQRLVAATDELVKSQFIEMFGDPRSNPYGHTCRPLSEISEIMSGITKGRKIKGTRTVDVPYICTANVQDGYVDWTKRKYMPATVEEISKYSLLCDDVLIIEGGDPDKVGRGCLAGTLPDPCIYQNHVFRIRVDKASISPEFLAAYLLLPSTKKYFLSCAKQTTGIATINKKQLKDLLVMFPDSAAQDEYIAVVRQSDKSKSELEQALSELTATYKRIISEQLS